MKVGFGVGFFCFGEFGVFVKLYLCWFSGMKLVGNVD